MEYRQRPSRLDRLLEQLPRRINSSRLVNDQDEQHEQQRTARRPRESGGLSVDEPDRAGHRWRGTSEEQRHGINSKQEASETGVNSKGKEKVRGNGGRGDRPMLHTKTKLHQRSLMV